MIRVEALVYRHAPEDPPVLGPVNLVIGDGEYVALIGPNGCGKTTLIRHFNALLSPVEGEVWVDGLNTKDPSAVGEIRQRVGMIFQNPEHQIVGMTVEEDVSFGPGNLNLPPPEIRRRVREALETVGLSACADRPPHTLSGGEKQLLAIAGILAMTPKHIVLDEPTSSLDPVGRRSIGAVLRQLKERGITIFQITHHLEEIVEADRVLVMEKGRIILDGRPAQVFRRVELLRELGLGIPQIAELMWHLRRRGAGVRTDILTVADACDEIARLLNKGGSTALEPGEERRGGRV